MSQALGRADESSSYSWSIKVLSMKLVLQNGSPTYEVTLPDTVGVLVDVAFDIPIDFSQNNFLFSFYTQVTILTAHYASYGSKKCAHEKRRTILTHLYEQLTSSIVLKRGARQSSTV